jgi:assimilatory nitrate reductase catalytic subunit
MTRTGRSARLGLHAPVPFVEINPADAARLGLAGGDLARVSSPYGSAVLEVVVSEGQRRGSLFAPIHWSGETSSDGRIGALVQPVVDPFSGQPDAKGTPVAIAPVPIARRGFVLSRAAVRLHEGTWWARAAVESGIGTLFATDLPPSAMAAWAAEAFAGAALAEYADAAAGIYRCAAFVDGGLAACVFIGPAEARPQWKAVKALFAGGTVDDEARRIVLSEMSLDGIAHAGPTICACFGVGLAVIRDAIVTGGAVTPAAIGEALRAGTNCGSCVPELRRIIARELGT